MIIRGLFRSLSLMCIGVACQAVFGTTCLGDDRHSSFRIMTYNVENLFDLTYQGGEYREFIPGDDSGWDYGNASIKYKNIARVLNDINADIAALQEVESDGALMRLQQELARSGKLYPYRYFSKASHQSVGCAVLSRFPAEKEFHIRVDRGRMRNILQLNIDVWGCDLVLFVNHWPSKKHPESFRLTAAIALKKAIDNLAEGCDYIVLGDLNSNYNENDVIAHDELLNDTGGKTGINHLLETVTSSGPVTEKDLGTCGRCLYNLWFELPVNQRWSYVFSGKGCSLDHILVPQALYDEWKIFYQDGSFRRFVPDYLVCGMTIKRWAMSDGKQRRHLGRGYSDHLPVYADFVVLRK